MNEKIKAKLNDKIFVEKLLKLEDENGVKECFEKENIKITDEEIKILGEQIEMCVEEFKKLSENELEKISGGKISYEPGTDNVSLLEGAENALRFLPRKVAGLIGGTNYENKDKTIQLVSGDVERLLTFTEVTAVVIAGYVYIPKGVKYIKEWWNKK